MDNINLFFLIHNLNNHSVILDDLMLFGATYLIYIAILLMFVLCFKGKTKERKALILAIITLPIAILFIKVIHIFINETRPFITYQFLPLTDNSPDASFPSRHATIISVIASSYLIFKSKWSAIFLIIMLWVGLSRIYVGVHYPLDVLGGFALGAISLIIVKLSVNLFRAKI